jgi:hypothetical protein
MKRMLWLVAAGGLFLAGCHKEKAPPAAQFGQVTVDVNKLSAAFADAAPEAKQSVSTALLNLRYGENAKALMSLDELVNNPAVTEPQKKIVNEVIEQVKQAINQAPPAQ